MMNINDIIQLIALCAIIFIPLGYQLHRWIPGLRRILSYNLLKPRHVKPAGMLKRGTDPKNRKES